MTKAEAWLELLKAYIMCPGKIDVLATTDERFEQFVRRFGCRYCRAEGYVTEPDPSGIGTKRRYCQHCGGTGMDQHGNVTGL